MEVLEHWSRVEQTEDFLMIQYDVETRPSIRDLQYLLDHGWQMIFTEAGFDTQAQLVLQKVKK